MTREEIIERMGWTVLVEREMRDVVDRIERIMRIVERQEREACAALAEKTICDTHIPTGVNIYGTRAARAIRARGDK